MLLYFSFKNHGSFKEESVFDMRSIGAYKEHPECIAQTADGEGVIKVAAIYGANASGKSQFVDAYSCFRRMAHRSFGGAEESIEENYSPFMFTPDPSQEPAEYEGCFATAHGELRYGFSYNGERVLEEWLYFKSYATERTSTILERGLEGLSLGASVRRECLKYAEDIPGDVLALSFFSRLNLKNDVFEQTARCIRDVYPITSRMCTANIEYRLRSYFRHQFDGAEHDRLMDLLSTVDIGITDITVEKTDAGVQVRTHHVGLDGRSYEAPLDIESSGTKKVIALYSFFNEAVQKGTGLLIDELDAQLHPLLLKYLVDMFKDRRTSGQLIFTAHDTTLLDKAYMRRDQIWVIEKNRAGESSLCSIAEFKPRNDLRLDTAYLGGIFGGIPKIIAAEEGE